MKCRIIICTLIRDCVDETLLGTRDFREGDTIYFDVPREDLRKWKDARIKIEFSAPETEL